MPNERRCGTCAKLEYYSDLLEGGLEVVYPECPHRAGVAEDDAACRLYEPLEGTGRGDGDAGGPETRSTCRDLGGYEGTNGEGYDSRRFHLRGHDQEELCIGCRVALDEWFKAGSDAK